MNETIITKINSEISEGITKECQVVYIMIELRKLLDRLRDIGDDNYKIIRFYCDWVAHTEKDYITQEIKEIIGEPSTPI